MVAKLSKSDRHWCANKVKLNIPQLTFAQLSQLGEHQNRTEEVPSLISTEGNFLAEFILLFPMLSTLSLLSLYYQPCQLLGKTDLISSLVQVSSFYVVKI